jgi:23S rRNA pseudoU1915 N3-methylase RlmH
MGNGQSIQKVNFEDVQQVVKNRESYLLINTLPIHEQHCLITNSILASQEEDIINNHLERGSKTVKIIIYGKNSNDEALYKKYQQLIKLGFSNVYLYLGGMFEWLLLQDIFGSDEFMTTSKHLDLLKYKPHAILNVALLKYV